MGFVAFTIVSSCSKDVTTNNENKSYESNVSPLNSNTSYLFCPYIGSSFTNNAVMNLSNIGQDHNLLLDGLWAENRRMVFYDTVNFYYFMTNEIKNAIISKDIQNTTPNDSLTFNQIQESTIWGKMTASDLSTVVISQINSNTISQIDYLQNNQLIRQSLATLLKQFFIEASAPYSSPNLVYYYQQLSSSNPTALEYLIVGGSLTIYEYSLCYWQRAYQDGLLNNSSNRVAPWLAALALSETVGFVGGCYAWAADEIYKGTNSTSVTACARNGLWGAVASSGLGGWLK